MNPTAIGKRLGIQPQAVNWALMHLGLQERNDRGEWELTEAGQAYGESLPYARNGRAGYQVLWGDAVLDLLPAQKGFDAEFDAG